MTRAHAGLRNKDKGQPQLPQGLFFRTTYFTRLRYSSVRVSISILSPISTKAGT